MPHYSFPKRGRPDRWHQQPVVTEDRPPAFLAKPSEAGALVKMRVNALPHLDRIQAADTSFASGTYTPSTKRTPPSSMVMIVTPPLSWRQLCSRRWAILKTRYRAFSRRRMRLATSARSAPWALFRLPRGGPDTKAIDKWSL